MNKLLRKFELVRYWLGVTGLLGLSLLMMAFIGLLTAGLPLQQKLQHQRQELAWLNNQPQHNYKTQAPVLDDEQVLQKFYRQFPSENDLSGVLAKIHALAAEKGVVLNVGEYKLSADANNANVARYEIIFPVQASYRNLRDFIDAASQQFPTLALSEINIKRDSIADNAAQVRLNYVLLLMRNPSWQ